MLASPHLGLAMKKINLFRSTCNLEYKVGLWSSFKPWV